MSVKSEASKDIFVNVRDFIMDHFTMDGGNSYQGGHGSPQRSSGNIAEIASHQAQASNSDLGDYTLNLGENGANGADFDFYIMNGLRSNNRVGESRYQN